MAILSQGEDLENPDSLLQDRARADAAIEFLKTSWRANDKLFYMQVEELRIEC